ncbi:MAG: hypothetical protein IT552_07360 [Sphingomonadaceae bacterium]|nr:hypothetical protein [Sphingomonadaceae bacterium]
MLEQFCTLPHIGQTRAASQHKTAKKRWPPCARASGLVDMETGKSASGLAKPITLSEPVRTERGNHSRAQPSMASAFFQFYGVELFQTEFKLFGKTRI